MMHKRLTGPRCYLKGAVIGILLVLVFGCIVMGRVRLEEHVLCRDVPRNHPEQYRGRSTVFSTTVPRIYSWIKLEDVEGRHTVNWTWRNPKGEVWAEREHTTDRGDYAWYITWSHLSLAGGAEPFLTGEWTVEVKLDRRVLFEDRFKLVPGWMEEQEPNDDRINSARFEVEKAEQVEQVRGELYSNDVDWYSVVAPERFSCYVSAVTWNSYPGRILSVYRADALDSPLPLLKAWDANGSKWGECVRISDPGVYYIKVSGEGLLSLPFQSSTEYFLTMSTLAPWWAGGR